MNTNEIRRSAIIMGIGYLFLTIYIFIVLSNEPISIAAAKELQFTFFVGFSFLTVGAFIADREHKYFKACFIAFLCLDALIIGYLIFGKMVKYVKMDASAVDLAMKIILACLNAGLALVNGLYINGAKELFGKKKNKRMYAYSLFIEYGVTAILLFSTIQSFIDFGEKGALASVVLDLVFGVIIYLNYAIFMFVLVHLLRHNHKLKQKNHQTEDK